MPKQWPYASPEVGEVIEEVVPQELQHFVVTSLINLAARNPYVFAGTLIGHGAWHLYDRYRGEVEVNREIGAPSTPTPASTILSKRRQGRASAEHGKHGGPRRESRRGGRVRRKECPKGHYWSYKEKKCLRSRFHR